MVSAHHQLLQSFVRNLPELVFLVSEKGRYIEMAGVSEHNPDNVIGKSVSDLFPKEVCLQFQDALRKAFKNGSGVVTTLEYTLKPSPELHIQLKNNEARTFELKINPLDTLYNSEKCAACLCRDITEQCECEKKLTDMSERDHLTGLYNRHKLFNELAHCFNEFQRYGHPCSLLLIDFDRFKHINDKYGHAAGDAALRHFATICQYEARSLDILCRYGGDEFCFILPNVNKGDASAFAHRLQERISERTCHFNDLVIPIAVSIGISEMCSNDRGYEPVINRADKDMYMRKNSSRLNNSVHR